MKAPIVGIDLGTTFSLAAILQDGKPTVLPNGVGELLTPSAVSVDDDGAVLVGAAARARATTHPTRTALAFKRDMGTDRVIELGPHEFRPPQLSALVLGAIKRDVEAALGTSIEEAVITVPAYFGDAQRQATRDAGVLAGLRVERIINEPTAAALAYGLHQRGREVRAIVLDLGGGTFDVTVLEIIEGVIEIQSSSGDARLGGEDFDAALASLVARAGKEHDHIDLEKSAISAARLREAAELAKKRLSERDKTEIVLVDVDGRDFQRTLTREEAERAWAPLLDRLRAPIHRALSDAGLRAEKIDEVLLVGGATRMPCIVKLASQIFGRLPSRSLPPDEAVAMGAAVQAALKEGNAAVDDLVVTDVAPFSMGLATVSNAGGHRVANLFTPVLERGTVIPASRVQRFSTVNDRQTVINLEVYQGEHSLCRDNVKLGEWSIRNLPARPAGEEAIDVRFTYDLNGILEIEATIVSTGKRSTFVVEHTPGRMSKEQLAKALEAMKKLKIDPRETLPNKTALARADALFMELAGPSRAILREAIALFQGALDAQDAKGIEETRAHLVATTERLRRERHP